MNRKSLTAVLLFIAFYSSNSFARTVFYGNYDSHIRLESDGAFELFENFFDHHLYLGQNDRRELQIYPALQYYTNLDAVYTLPVALGNLVLHSYFERKGRTDYAAHLKDVRISQNTVIEKYSSGYDFFPEVQELSLQAPLFLQGLRLHVGKFKPHRIGWTGYLFGDRLSNYGATVGYTKVFTESTLLTNFHWDKPDYNNKLRLAIGGIPKPQQDNEFYTSGTKADRFLFDIAYLWKNHKIQGFLSYLLDRTSNVRRRIIFFDNLNVNKDALGNIGGSLTYELGDFTFWVEGARNLGHIYNSGTGGRGKNIPHEGWMLANKVSLNTHSWITPSIEFFYFTGNDVSEFDILKGNTNNIDVDEGYQAGKPLANKNLHDSTSEIIIGELPLLASGGFNALMLGIGRPTAYEGDGNAKNNLAAYKGSLTFSPIQKLTVIADFWHMNILHPGYGTSTARGRVKLDHDYGRELDFMIFYNWSNHIKLSGLGGIFFPGTYHTEFARTDSDPLEFSPVTINTTEAETIYGAQMGIKLFY